MLRSSLFAFSLFAAPMAHATDVPPAMSQYIYDDLMKWINDTRIVQAITAQNGKTGNLTEAELIARDTIWRAEVGSAHAPLINEVLNAPLSTFLKEHLANSQGRITEIFVMDHKGLNVAASAVTSDYWQGDEAKFQQTYPRGSGAVFIDKIEMDESTQTYQGQVSFAVTDPATGNVVGAITVGLDAGAFF
jgi:hypothetical protein